jgi:hypothetical protein
MVRWFITSSAIKVFENQRSDSKVEIGEAYGDLVSQLFALKEEKWIKETLL